MKARLVFAWYDLWVGVFIDRPNRRVYIFPVPCLGVVVYWPAGWSARPRHPNGVRMTFDRALAARRQHLALTRLVVAADRMRDNWAESDKAGQNLLWRDLHTAAELAGEFVYPLAGWSP